MWAIWEVSGAVSEAARYHDGTDETEPEDVIPENPETPAEAALRYELTEDDEYDHWDFEADLERIYDIGYDAGVANNVCPECGDQFDYYVDDMDKLEGTAKEIPDDAETCRKFASGQYVHEADPEPERRAGDKPTTKDILLKEQLERHSRQGERKIITHNGGLGVEGYTKQVTLSIPHHGRAIERLRKHWSEDYCGTIHVDMDGELIVFEDAQVKSIQEYTIPGGIVGYSVTIEHAESHIIEPEYETVMR